MKCLAFECFYETHVPKKKFIISKAAALFTNNIYKLRLCIPFVDATISVPIWIVFVSNFKLKEDTIQMEGFAFTFLMGGWLKLKSL